MKQFGYILVVLAVLLFAGRCANVAQGPGGGPKDSIPPMLLTTEPEYRTVAQKPKRISLIFNEYVQVKNATENVVISPPSLMRAEVRTRGKKLEVRFNDTLFTNTTYTIDFGESVSDLNEGNPFPSFRYVFSTGAVIDSMLLTGKVFDAYTKEPVPKISVCLYENHSDTAIYKTLPSVVARTDNWGYFTLQNIKPLTYSMVAFLDKNNNYRYDAGAELLAFEDSLVVPDLIVDYEEMLRIIDEKDTATLLARPYQRELYAFTESVGKQFLTEHKLESARKIVLTFNRPHPDIISFQLNGIDSSDLVKERNRLNDTLIYWITTPVLPDTISAEITYMRTDSLDMLSPFNTKLEFQQVRKEEQDKDKDKESKNKDGEEEKKKETLTPDINFTPETLEETGVIFKFNTLTTKVDTGFIQLWRIDDSDKTKRQPEPYTWTQDSLKIRQFYLQAKWQVSTDYELLILPEAFSDLYGLQNDTISKKATTLDPANFSSIQLHLTGIDSAQQFIVHLLDEKKTRILRTCIADTNKSLQLDYLKPAKYSLRFIWDTNKNGFWDTGNYLEKLQPEKVEFYTLSKGNELIELPEHALIKQNIDVKKVFGRDRRKEVLEIKPDDHDHDHEHDSDHDHDHDHEPDHDHHHEPETEEQHQEKELSPAK